MKLVLILLLASGSALLAQAPRKEPLNKYRKLWENSLVTEKPLPDVKEKKDPVSELDDYVLGGWTKTSQGYLVSLINVKDPKKRLTIAPGMPNSGGYQVLDVKRDPLNFKASEVLVKVDGLMKWIGYDDKFLKLQQPPAVAKTVKKPVKPSSSPQPAAASSTTKAATPRVRRIAIPTQKRTVTPRNDQ